MRHWFQHIIEGSVYQGLEIFEVDDSIYFSLLKVQKKNGELNTVFERAFHTIEELTGHINAKNVILLVINSSKILKKQVSLDPKLDVGQWVVNAFPNLDLESFYYGILDVGGLGIVSIGKKEDIDGTLDMLKGHGIVPSRVSLGISDLQNSIPHLQVSNILGSNFQLRNISASDFVFEPKGSTQQNPMKIGGLTISTTGLLPFSSVLGYLKGSREESNLSVLNRRFDNNFKNHRLYSVGLKLGIGVLLTALLLNFLLFTHYRAKVESMETLSSSEQQLSMLKTIKDRIATKEQRLNMLLGSSNSRSTFYMDRIALGLPTSIQLDQMEYQPLLKPVREGKLIALDQNNIQISGQSNDKDGFAQWMEKLDREDWVEKMKILGYEYADKNSDRFSLKIEINEAGQ
ncbi:hypothetical protein [Flagellimonas meishanensis]|uniref:hypothetical protein n=1 Tax=Flagellimonas meishanensis TaxID=2873264 RepID=UPI001CA67BAF|nr:hypothetical protein [[Muricauda] meishanensis]